MDGADWRDPDWPRPIREATGGGVDVALDSAGGDAWDGILRALRPGGTLVNFGDTAGDFSNVAGRARLLGAAQHPRHDDG